MLRPQPYHARTLKERRKENSLFYSAYATNHPGDSTPDYFYYYMQTSAAYGQPGYNAESSKTSTDPPFDYWVEAKEDPPGKTIDAPGANANQTLNYIDLFAWACRHEKNHHDSFAGWWITGAYNLSLHDRDGGTWGDLLPDPLEPNMPESQGGPYLATTIDSHPNDPYTVGNSQLPDSQRFNCMTAPVWAVGSADTVDWAYPGKNWQP